MAAALRFGPYALLAAVAAGLGLAWEELPARHPVHWGTGGADHWVDLSIRTAGAPLLAGVLAVAWLGLLRRFVLANSPPLEDPARSRRLAARVTLAMQWLFALVFGASAIPTQGPGLVVAAAGAGVLLLPMALVATYAGAPASPEAAAPAPPDGWLFLPRANGTGLRAVPHHPRIWRAVALLVAGPVAIALAASLG